MSLFCNDHVTTPDNECCPSSPSAPSTLGCLTKEDMDRLDSLYEEMTSAGDRMIGFPENQEFDYCMLERFLKVSLNNCGDPFGDTHYSLNTYGIEREVIGQVAKLSGADPDDVWGYVTNGGTEGNTCGVYIARERFPDGIVYFSSHAHYSAAKIVRLLRCDYKIIDGNIDGTMNLEHFQTVIEQNKLKPAIVFANVGTTMHQAVDDIPAIQTLLEATGVTDVHIHADAALSGFVLPYLDNAPPYNFSAGIDSMAISGHKFVGTPMPCGVVLTRRSLVDAVGDDVDYAGVRDNTITGSRNGLTPLMLWVSLRRMNHSEMEKEVQSCLAVADYTIERFKELGIHAWRHPYAFTVVFPKPSMYMIKKWNLAPNSEISHVICSRHVTTSIIDKFFADMVSNMIEARTHESMEAHQRIIVLQRANADRPQRTFSM